MYKSISLIISLILLSITIILTFNTKKINKNDINLIKDSVYKLISIGYEDQNLYTATGFVFKNRSNKSFIVTNAHFCNTTGGVFLMQNTENYLDGSAIVAEVEYTAEEKDLCIASTNVVTEPLKLSFDSVHFSDELKTIGAPEGNYPVFVNLYFSTYVTPKIITDYFSKVKFKRNPFFVSGFIEQGQSGSPVFNNRNEVIGIIFAKMGSFSGIVISAKEIDDISQKFFAD